MLILAFAAISRVDAPEKPFLANSSKALSSNLLFESLAMVFISLSNANFGLKRLCYTREKNTTVFYPLLEKNLNVL